jgi:hypothetical protein
MSPISESGAPLLQAVAERIIARHLARGLARDIQVMSGFLTYRNRGIDIAYTTAEGAHKTLKVKPDCYCGTDPAKIADRKLAFYRTDTSVLSFEAVADAATRQPGWMVASEADDLYYYFIAIAQHEDEVRALLGEPDEVFFSELAVDRDNLIVIPMARAREWFERNGEAYPTRPVFLGTKSAWHRLVPSAVVQSELPGVRIVGPVFASLVP